MSFQGDVRGIGLAELLQGLARGRKAGVLTLTAKNGQRALLGVDGGSTFLLPDPEEDIEDWRDRVRDAYADDSEFRIDYLRMAEIARATRLENLYTLLDGEGVHFRFEPGPIPGQASVRTGDEEQKSEVYCDGLPVEMLLLEYARISDELAGAGDVSMLHIGVVPSVLDPVACQQEAGRLANACTGRLTLQEVADRLGTPIRQVRLTLIALLRKGAMCLRTPSEVLHLALDELTRSNCSRAAARLRSWVHDANGGPLAPSEAAMLAREWLAGRLAQSLSLLDARTVRIVLRRMDHALCDASTSAAHWEEAHRLFPKDRIIRQRFLGFLFESEPLRDRLEPGELLDLARNFQDSHTPMRAGPALVMAAFLQPESIPMQLELGQGLLTAGRVGEASPWIISAVETLIEDDLSDRALPALRALLQADPRNRDARQLYSRAKRNSTQTRKLRKNILIGAAGAAILVGAAVVRVQRESERETRLGSVRMMMMSDPTTALRELNQYFAESTDPEVLELRNLIQEQQRAKELALRTDWLETYNAASQECTQGDPIIGITMAMEIPPPPRLLLLTDPWPLEGDIYNGLVESLETRVQSLGEPREGDDLQVRTELEIQRQLQQLTTIVEEVEIKATDTQVLAGRFASLHQRIDKRQAERTRKRIEREGQELRDSQNQLWQQATDHARNGDFVRAARVYQELLESDVDGKITELLSQEIAENEKHLVAVRDAQDLATRGEHDQALERLRTGLGDDYDPLAFMVPWDVDSFPSGASVRFLREDRVLRTPFTIQTTFGTRSELLFESPGFEPRRLVVERPSDQFVYLSRSPQRSWGSEGRVDALPVNVGGDSIVVDRRGKMARLSADGGIRWEQEVRTLSGIARSPVFMPGRPGSLLVVTEEGTAWIVAAEDGDLEGPWDLGSPPVSGPYATQSVVRVLLQNGQSALWKNRLKPYTPDASSGTSTGADDLSYRFGSNAGLTILRRRHAHEPKLDSPWNGWSVRAEDEVYRIENSENASQNYTVLRSGDWEYLAWEAPLPGSPDGRLWISDGQGLRGFVPPPTGTKD